MEPEVTAVTHIDLYIRPLDHHDGFHGRRRRHSLIHDFFQLNDLSVSLKPIHGHHNPCLGVIDPISKSKCAEPGINNTVYSADLGASEHHNSDFRNVWKIYRHPVSLLDAKRFEYIGKLVGSPVEVKIGHTLPGTALAFKNDGYFVFAMALNMTVKGIVSNVGLASCKPFEKRCIGAVKHRVPLLEPV